MEDATNPKTGKIGTTANAAVLREALEKIGAMEVPHNFQAERSDIADACYDLTRAIKLAKAALAAPPRNCDLPDMEQRFSRICKEHHCGNCPHHLTSACSAFAAACIAHWLLDTAKVSPDAAPSASTPAAVLREALEAALPIMRNCPFTHYNTTEVDAVVSKMEAALAAPPRNCDVYDSESCRMAYHLHGDGILTMQAFANWLFAPATKKEGGAR